MHKHSVMFKCDHISVYWCFSLLFLHYGALLRSLVRQKSLVGGKFALVSVGVREQAQEREKLRDSRSEQANGASRELRGCSQPLLSLAVLQEPGKGSQGTEITRRISWGLCRIYCISESH